MSNDTGPADAGAAAGRLQSLTPEEQVAFLIAFADVVIAERDVLQAVLTDVWRAVWDDDDPHRADDALPLIVRTRLETLGRLAANAAIERDRLRAAIADALGRLRVLTEHYRAEGADVVADQTAAVYRTLWQADKGEQDNPT